MGRLASARIRWLIASVIPNVSHRAGSLPHRSWTRASALAQERWGSDPDQWLTFGVTLAMSQRILAEVSRPLDPAEREPA